MKIEDLHYDIKNDKPDETSFNLQKWRYDTHMDYLLAVYLLYQSSNSLVTKIIFDTIFKVTRLYIPDVLYKYY